MKSTKKIGKFQTDLRSHLGGDEQADLSDLHIRNRKTSQQIYSKVNDLQMNEKDLTKFTVFRVESKLAGQVLMNRYQISNYLDNGCYGQVLEVIDRENPEKKLVIKVSQQFKSFHAEINAMVGIYKQMKKKMSQVPVQQMSPALQNFMSPSDASELQYGLLEVMNSKSPVSNSSAPIRIEHIRDLLETKVKYNQFIVMPRFGQNLSSYFKSQKYKISKVSAFDFAIKVLHMLEQIHEAGFVYNDLKLENILVDMGDQIPTYAETKAASPSRSCFEECTIRIIDFGFCTRFIDEGSGEHIKLKKVESFRGNLKFASLNQLDFFCTSRRDDLISLCYLMVYMLNLGQIKGLYYDKGKSDVHNLKIAINAKKKHTINELCQGKASGLRKFMFDIFSLDFEEKPNYDELRWKLKKLITEEASKHKQPSVANSAFDTPKVDKHLLNLKTPENGPTTAASGKSSLISVSVPSILKSSGKQTVQIGIRTPDQSPDEYDKSAKKATSQIFYQSQKSENLMGIAQSKINGLPTGTTGNFSSSGKTSMLFDPAITSPQCTLVNLKTNHTVEKSFKHSASKYTIDGDPSEFRLPDGTVKDFELNVSELSSKKKKKSENAQCCISFADLKKKVADFFTSKGEESK